MPPNVALIGCGAIAQAFYLPAIAANRSAYGDVWLVDPSDEALSRVPSTLSGRRARRLLDVSGDLDAVIVATPNQLHYPLALEALHRGAHVLIEKPFVVRPDEGESLIAAARANERLIGVNQTRRLHPLASELRTRIATGEFGPLRRVRHREGTKLTWPFESGAGFMPGAERTGVIMDFGVHVLDFYHFLLQPTWDVVSAIHDGFAGPEGLAECELSASGAPVSVQLSRYYTQENVALMEFELADIRFDVYDDTHYTVTRKSGASSRTVNCTAPTQSETAAERLMKNFLAAVTDGAPLICNAESALPVINVLDEIYSRATRYPPALGAV